MNSVWSGFFSEERARLLFEVVEGLDPKYFRTLVDEFIKSKKQAPTVAEFKARIWHIESEKARKFQEEAHAHRNAELDRHRLPDEEISRRMGLIKQIYDGTIDPADKETFMAELKWNAENSKMKFGCNLCEDRQELVRYGHDHIPCAFRCPCTQTKTSLLVSKNLPVWDKNKYPSFRENL